MARKDPALLNVSFKKSKTGNTVATVRILTEGRIKWTRVSGGVNADRRQLFYQAIAEGKKHCRGAVSYQLPFMMKQAMARGIEPRWSDKMIEEELA